MRKRNYKAEYQKKDKEVTNKKSREFRTKTRIALITFVGGEKGLVCNRCGFNDIRVLQVDHVFGGGLKEVNNKSKLKDNVRYLKHIKENPMNYQLLCANCNWIKRHENNEIPHQKAKY